ncbi:lysozyme [Mucilaginibacter sp. UR6-1]|uniref:lysozyme n=1 Tax=Mucilaginibacter sp. UR6-1 TaxID=1435643 RepID=UPI001E35097A|nr:lysozyme [Mucilaginibacter sp. UR6-1]
MRIDKAGRDFIYKEEGVKLKAYLDVAGIPTIGVGFTYYPHGGKIKLGDTITIEQCTEYFNIIVQSFEDAVSKAVKININQHQFNALVSFSFNVGIQAFKSSTLLKKINSQSTEQDIKAEFLKWKRAGGKVVDGLLKRRIREANLYFTA